MIKNYIKYLILLFVFFIQLSLAGFAQKKEKFEHISVGSGLSQSVVTSIYQDSRGYMWFGTQNGLNKYDGYEFVSFSINDTIRSDFKAEYIQDIVEDDKGNMYIGTQNSGLYKYDREKDLFSILNISDDSLLLINTLTVDNNILWVGTNKGLYIYDIESNVFRQHHIDNNLKIKDFVNDELGNLWVVSNLSIYRLNLKTLKAVKIADSESFSEVLQVNELYCGEKYSDTHLLFGTDNGLLRYCIPKDKFDSPGFSGNLLNFEVYSIKKDRKGNLWLGTFGSGLIMINSLTNKAISYKNIPGNFESLSSNYILSLFIDNTNVLWIGTYGDAKNGGINKLDLSKVKFQTIKFDDKNLISPEVYSVCQVSDSILFLGTDKGLKKFSLSKNKFINFEGSSSELEFLNNQYIYTILHDSKNRLWIGTAENGLYYIEKEDWSNNKPILNQFVINNLEDNYVDILSLFEDTNNNIWIGTTNGFYMITDNLIVLKGLYAQDATEAYEIYNIKEDHDKNIWMGTNNGLVWFDPINNQRKIFTNDPNNINSISNNIIYSIYEDSEEKLWIGTDGGGVSILSPDRKQFTNITINNGLVDNYIYAVVEDHENNKWVSTNKGLSKIISLGNEKFSIINYNVTKWLNTNSFNIGAYFTGRNNLLFFGTNKGVIFFNPDNIKGNTIIPKVVLTDFTIFFNSVPVNEFGPLRKHISEADVIYLDSHDKRFSFEFAALSYNQNEKNEYAYMLENFDDDWIYCKTERRADYAGIQPGTYVFRVKAANNQGIWNETGIAVKVIIEPPLWKKTWFQLIILCIIIGLIILFFRIRTAKLKAQQHKLEEKVKERTLEIEKKNEEIIKQSDLLKKTNNELNAANEELNTTNEELNTTLDNLKSTQQQLIESEKMASLGQLTAGVAHEINNPINFVSGNIKPLKRDIDDLLELLNIYDQSILNNQLEKYFKEVNSYKENVDYEYLINEINELLQGIEEGASRTTAIVKGLRNFSRLDEEDMKLANINDGLQSTLLILNNKIKNKANIVTNYGKIPEILCYPGKVNQVFMNIINNAVDALTDKGNVYITTNSDENNVYISIKDDGIGIPKEYLQRIFDPFFTTKDVGSGTGLGLSISYGIIEKHNGKIDVESEYQKGTEFKIQLPIVNKKN